MQATLNRPANTHHHAAITNLATHAHGPVLIACQRLIANATIAAWALRPDDQLTITQDQYEELAMYAAYPYALGQALAANGDRRYIRKVMDLITAHVADLIN
ncbi:hypothetical protein [Kitasatospora aureofaciens]|uniref:hypothetical protein n=1 Tax=Kitasatospora aureofaciens TaxID=1894 RepID=UPI0037C9DA8B